MADSRSSLRDEIEPERNRSSEATDAGRVSFWDEETALAEDPPAISPEARLLGSPLPVPQARPPEEPDAQRPRSSGAFRLGAVLEHRWRLDRVISQGGMGRIYLATDLRTGHPVVVKALLPEASGVDLRQRFELEAEACASARSPHVVELLASSRTPTGEPFHVTTYLEGASLGRALRDAPRQTPRRALELAIDLARGLDAIHAAGFIHRDLKPDNIMIGRAPGETQASVRIIDFGLAKAVVPGSSASEARDADLTRAGILLGSPRYMAPEQVRSQEVGPPTDVYALGTVLFQVLTGSTPFGPGEAFDLMHQQLASPVPRLAERDPELAGFEGLQRIVDRCLAKSPHDRYPSAAALGEALSAELTRLSAPAPRVPPPSLTSDLVLDAPPKAATAEPSPSEPANGIEPSRLMRAEVAEPSPSEPADGIEPSRLIRAEVAEPSPSEPANGIEPGLAARAERSGARPSQRADDASAVGRERSGIPTGGAAAPRPAARGRSDATTTSDLRAGWWAVIAAVVIAAIGSVLISV